MEGARFVRVVWKAGTSMDGSMCTCVEKEIPERVDFDDESQEGRRCFVEPNRTANII